MARAATGHPPHPAGTRDRPVVNQGRQWKRLDVVAMLNRSSDPEIHAADMGTAVDATRAVRLGSSLHRNVALDVGLLGAPSHDARVMPHVRPDDLAR